MPSWVWYYSLARKIILSAWVFFFQAHFYCGFEIQPMNYWQPDFFNGSKDQQKWLQSRKIIDFSSSQSTTLSFIYLFSLREPDAIFLHLRLSNTGWRAAAGQWSNTHHLRLLIRSCGHVFDLHAAPDMVKISAISFIPRWRETDLTRRDAQISGCTWGALLTERRQPEYTRWTLQFLDIKFERFSVEMTCGPQ